MSGSAPYLPPSQHNKYQRTDVRDSTPESAIHRILRAERDAGEAVESCRRQGREIIGQARDQARRIGARVDERIGAVHARADRSINETVDGIRREMDALPRDTHLDEGDRRRLDQAVAGLVRELVGEPQ